MPCEAEGFRGEKKSGSESKEGSYTTNSGHTEGPHIPMSNVCAANADARQNRATVPERDVSPAHHAPGAPHTGGYRFLRSRRRGRTSAEPVPSVAADGE